MEEEILKNCSYYETAYLDDYNTKHIVYVKDKEDLDYIKERYIVLNSKLKTI